MSNNLRQQITALQQHIARQEAEATRLDAEIGELERELAAFTQRFDRVVGLARAKLDAVRAAIDELERRRYLERYANLPPEEAPRPLGFTPVAEQYRQVWHAPPEPPPPPSTERPRESSLPGDPETRLKRLYRGLARRYHPDLAPLPAERDYRTRLMVMINEAYEARDLDTLLLLATQPEGIDPDVPVAVLRLRQLRQASEELDRRLDNLRAERARLIHNDLMRLKTEDRLARQRGRDLLREMADTLEAEYAEAMQTLQRLRARG